MYSSGVLALILLVSSGVSSWHVFGPDTGGFESRVLGGNYGRRGMHGIPDLRSRRTNPMQDGPTNEGADEEDQESTKIPFDLQGYYSQNFNNVIMKAVNISQMDESPQFLSIVQKCDDQIEQVCPRLAPDVCRKIYIRCLVEGNNLMGPLTKVIAESLGSLCRPLRTKYTRMFENSTSGFPWLKTYSEFLKYLEITPQEFPVTAFQLGNALPSIFIKYTLTPLLPLKDVLRWMEKEMSLQQTVSRGFTTNNPGCLTLQMTHSIEILIDLFLKDRSLMDILLPGFVFFNAGSKYMGGNTFGMAIVTETIRMFTGTGTGFGCNFENSGSGEKSDAGNCDELGKNMQPGFPIPTDFVQTDTDEPTDEPVNNCDKKKKAPKKAKGDKSGGETEPNEEKAEEPAPEGEPKDEAETEAPPGETAEEGKDESAAPASENSETPEENKEEAATEAPAEENTEESKRKRRKTGEDKPWKN